jgi:ribose transport system permease protein
VFVCVVTVIANPKFVNAYNLQNIIRWTSPRSSASCGICDYDRGIDLSIGSTIGLIGTLLAWLLTEKAMGLPAALGLIALVSLALGLLHGLLITKLGLQPFVTLCGLLLYRGIARWVSDDQTLGFGEQFAGLRYLANGHPFALPIPGLDAPVQVPMPFLIMIVLAVLAAVFLNLTIFGRYLLALGRNEQAARYSGINTDNIVILAYITCSLLAGLGGVLFAVDVNSVQPSGLGIL